MHRQMIGHRRKQRSEIARRRSIIRSGQIERQAVFKKAAAVCQGEGAVAQSIAVELQAGKAVRIAPKAGGDKIQRVFEVAALRLKIVRTQIHPFGPDGFVAVVSLRQPACGSRMISSICGLGNSPGTCAAKLRARVTASHAAPDWLRLKY